MQVVYASAEAAKEAVPIFCPHCNAGGVNFRRQYLASNDKGIHTFKYVCLKCSRIIDRRIYHWGDPKTWEKEGWKW